MTRPDAVVIRPAEAGDVVAAVPLIYSSGPDAYDYVFSLPGQPALEYMRFAFRDGAGFLGHRNHMVAVIGDRVVGTGSFYGHDAYKRLVRESLGQAMRHYGMVGSLRVMRQSMPVSAMMPPAGKGARYVANLAVAEDRRGAGVGAALLAHAAEEARVAGDFCCLLDVAEDNDRAAALYRRLGYEVISEAAFAGDRSRGIVPGHRRMRLLLE